MKNYLKRKNFLFLIIAFAVVQSNCSKTKSGGEAIVSPVIITPAPGTNDVSYWLTKADQSVLLQQQNTVISFGTIANSNGFIDVDSAQSYQAIDGFGYTLTGGSAELINNMSVTDKQNLLNDLFSTTSGSSAGVSYLRVSLGASDLSSSVFSYDDMPAGQTDMPLANFSLDKDSIDLVPVLQQILTLNPAIKIMASPWSPPVWMKDNNSSIGGGLQPQYYAVYAKYFVKYIQAMKAKGITIDAVTIQNEPQYGGNNPSMVMSAAQQADFVKNHLGPAFAAASVTTKIIIWDHNCDNANYPISILNDAAAKQYVSGSAFHLYAGDISALGTVHNAHPDKNVYFTEQWTQGSGSFSGDFKYHLKNVVIGSMANWSKTALIWNLASNPAYGPHTPGGCTECKGAVTISGSTITKNVAYYIIAQIARFVPANSIRIYSNGSGISNIAFKRTDGKKVLLVLNEGNADLSFNIRYNAKWAPVTVPANAAGTFIW